MNLAILVSVSKYLQKQNNLPACANDHVLMETVLSQSGKFSEILNLTTDTSSSNIKSELARFVKAHQGQAVNELFFYYTGHGDFYNDEFYFLFSDYDDTKRQQTALSNSELDAMLRSLSPALAVKVIDACYSGIPYVKNLKSIEKAIEASKGQYNKCYFMFSSQKDEASYQDAHLSDFTESFARSLVVHKHDTIRYKDIIDYITDEFQNQGNQTPNFLIQTDLTDVFCSITKEMQDEINEKLVSGMNKQGSLKQDLTSTATTMIPPTNESKPTILELVMLDSNRYCSETEALSAIESIKQHIEAYSLNSLLSGLFRLENSFRSDFSASPKIGAVASWLHENENNYFVTVEYRIEEYEDTIMVPKPYPSVLGRHFGATFAALGSGELESKVVTRKRRIPNGLRLNVTPPFCAAEVKLVPLYENLPWLSENLVVVFSKSALRLFFTTVRYKERNWNERVIAEDVKWKTKEVGLKAVDDLKLAVTSIIREVEESVLKLLHDKFKITDAAQVDPHN